MSSNKNYILLDENIVVNDKGTTIEQMHLSYKDKELTLHINPNFVTAVGLDKERWGSLKQKLQKILDEGTVHSDECDIVFRFDLKSPHDIRIEGEHLEIDMELKGTSDRTFYDRETARKFTRLIKHELFGQ